MNKKSIQDLVLKFKNQIIEINPELKDKSNDELYWYFFSERECSEAYDVGFFISIKYGMYDKLPKEIIDVIERVGE